MFLHELASSMYLSVFVRTCLYSGTLLGLDLSLNMGWFKLGLNPEWLVHAQARSNRPEMLEIAGGICSVIGRINCIAKKKKTMLVEEDLKQATELKPVPALI